MPWRVHATLSRTTSLAANASPRQTECVSLRRTGRPAPCPCRAVSAALAALCSVSAAGPRSGACRAERVLAGSAAHSGRGIPGRRTEGATAARSSSSASAAWPARRAAAGGAPGLWGAGSSLDAHWDPGRTSGRGSGAYRLPAAPGSRLLLALGTER